MAYRWKIVRAAVEQGISYPVFKTKIESYWTTRKPLDARCKPLCIKGTR